VKLGLAMGIMVSLATHAGILWIWPIKEAPRQAIVEAPLSIEVNLVRRVLKKKTVVQEVLQKIEAQEIDEKKNPSAPTILPSLEKKKYQELTRREDIDFQEMIEEPSPLEMVTPAFQGAKQKAVPIASQNLPPLYPYVARLRGYEGRVVVSIQVLNTGDVGFVKLLETSGYLILDKSAMKAVKKWKFTPAVIWGQNVESWEEQSFNFNLE
jgi:protein TonB